VPGVDGQQQKWWKKKFWRALCTLTLPVPTLSGLLVNPYFLNISDQFDQ
jgi:hypothetical protein